MLRILFAAALLLMTAAPSLAADPPASDQATEQFFRLLQSGQTSKAYEGVGRGTLMEQKKAELQNMANQTAGALQIYGKIVDWELMGEKAWSPSYTTRNYLVRTERGPLFFNVHLYRAPAGWVIGQLYFTDLPKNLPAL